MLAPSDRRLLRRNPSQRRESGNLQRRPGLRCFFAVKLRFSVALWHSQDAGLPAIRLQNYGFRMRTPARLQADQTDEGRPPALWATCAYGPGQHRQQSRDIWFASQVQTPSRSHKTGQEPRRLECGRWRRAGRRRRPHVELERGRSRARARGSLAASRSSRRARVGPRPRARGPKSWPTLGHISLRRCQPVRCNRRRAAHGRRLRQEWPDQFDRDREDDG